MIIFRPQKKESRVVPKKLVGCRAAVHQCIGYDSRIVTHGISHSFLNGRNKQNMVMRQNSC